MTVLISTPLQVIFIDHPKNLLCIQVVSEIGGRILRYVVYGRKQGEKFHINLCPETLDISIITTLDINTREKNHISYTNNNGPRMIVLLLPPSSSHNIHASLHKRCPKCPPRSVKYDAAFLIFLIILYLKWLSRKINRHMIYVCVKFLLCFGP